MVGCEAECRDPSEFPACVCDIFGTNHAGSRARLRSFRQDVLIDSICRPCQCTRYGTAWRVRRQHALSDAEAQRPAWEQSGAEEQAADRRDH